jgi:hypothetical protein
MNTIRGVSLPGAAPVGFRRNAVKRTTTCAAIALACLAIAACADNTGAVDDLGHNGFDRMACSDLKILTFDVEYEPAGVAQRSGEAKSLREEAGKAGDPQVRAMATEFLTALDSGDRTEVSASAKQAVKICSF